MSNPWMNQAFFSCHVCLQWKKTEFRTSDFNNIWLDIIGVLGEKTGKERYC